VCRGVVATVTPCTHVGIDAELVDTGCLRAAAAYRDLDAVAGLVPHVA
jgi:hypothetical protein